MHDQPNRWGLMFTQWWQLTAWLSDDSSYHIYTGCCYWMSTGFCEHEHWRRTEVKACKKTRTILVSWDKGFCSDAAPGRASRTSSNPRGKARQRSRNAFVMSVGVKGDAPRTLWRSFQRLAGHVLSYGIVQCVLHAELNPFEQPERFSGEDILALTLSPRTSYLHIDQFLSPPCLCLTFSSHFLHQFIHFPLHPFFWHPSKNPKTATK